MVVGCGALGNEVLKNLVLMGVRHLVIVDLDLVEAGNLARSVLYRKSDVGKRKVDVARKALLDINPELDINTIFGDVAYDVGLGLIRRMDVIIGCVDNRWARYCIQRLCHRAGKTWIDGGILDLTGMVKVFRPGETCYACSLSREALADMQRRMPCAGVIRRREETGHAPTTPIIASIIGAVQAQEALKVIGNREEALGNREEVTGNRRLAIGDSSNACQPNRMFSYDGDTMTVLTPVFEAWDDDCALHGEWDISKGEWLFVDNENIDMPISHYLTSANQPPASAIQPLADSNAPSPSPHHRVIVLNEPFVDYIVSRKTDERIKVMLPAHKVEDYFTATPQLSGLLMSDFYQHEYREIDATFPYPDLTLRQLGIPEDEILRVKP